jgi:ABC-2 type transport system ATP-binding protein
MRPRGYPASTYVQVPATPKRQMIVTAMKRGDRDVIQVRSLERRFGPRRVLADVDLTVRAGEVHGLIGPGGAGKTTLLRLLAGQLPPTAGAATVLGRPAGSPQLRGRVGLVRADGEPLERISGLEDLLMAGRGHGMAAGAAVERARAVLQQVGLARAGDGPVAAWTPGMRLRLAFARALLTEPDVLLVDEPPAGVDPAGCAAVRALVSSHALAGTAIIWATRRLDELHGLASALTLLAGGRVRYAGSVEALAQRALAVSAEDVADRLRHAA